MHSQVAMEVQVGYLRMELQGGSPLEQQQHSALRGNSTGRALPVVGSHPLTTGSWTGIMNNVNVNVLGCNLLWFFPPTLFLTEVF